MPHPEQPSYEELAARNAELLAMVAEQAALIGALRAEVAALRRQAGRDSSNSSQPPSRDSPAAKAEKKGGQREGRRARPGRPQGRQPATGPPGSYPDRTCTSWQRRVTGQVLATRYATS